jgi:hypothetical protein
MAAQFDDIISFLRSVIDIITTALPYCHIPLLLALPLYYDSLAAAVFQDIALNYEVYTQPSALSAIELGRSCPGAIAAAGSLPGSTSRASGSSLTQPSLKPATAFTSFFESRIAEWMILFTASAAVAP